MRSEAAHGCPRCAPASDRGGCGLHCLVCGLRREEHTRLWLEAENRGAPAGFDIEAAGRLAELAEQDHFWMRGRRALVERLLGRLLTASTGGGVSDALELGCGTGQILPLLEAHARRVVAVDAHRSLLERAQDASNRAILVQGDAIATGLPTRSFDLVVAFDVIEHVDPDAFLGEARRLARERAHLLISAPAFPALWSDLDVRAGHRCRYRWRRLEAELARNGWRPLGHTHYQFVLFPLVYASRRFGDGGRQRGRERRPPAFLDRLLGAVNQAEVNVLNGLTLPFGSSLFAWARAEQ